MSSSDKFPNGLFLRRGVQALNLQSFESWYPSLCPYSIISGPVRKAFSLLIAVHFLPQNTLKNSVLQATIKETTPSKIWQSVAYIPRKRFLTSKTFGAWWQEAPQLQFNQEGFIMTNYECECTVCRAVRQIHFENGPYPEYGDLFSFYCSSCGAETPFTRVLTRKTRAEVRRRQAEQDLRNTIVERCAFYGFSCRFLYQSVIVTTNLADWCLIRYNKLRKLKKAKK